MKPAPVDYLQALRLKEAAAEITLGGRTFRVERARLGRHYALEAILIGLKSEADLANVTAEYVAQAAGVTIEAVDAVTPGELAAAFQVVSDLNRFQGTLAVLWPHRPPGQPAPPTPDDYPHRSLASMVAILAHAYGWSVDHILEGLGPEEATCYLQEALVIDHEEREFGWLLSDRAIDAQGKPRTYPPLKWGMDPLQAKRRRERGQRPEPSWARPAGIVISASEVLRRKAPDE